MARPWRLDRNCYIGLQCYFVTTCTLDHQKAFLGEEFCVIARRELFAQAACHGLAIPAYCLMPDHAHLLLRARDEGAELTGMLALWKQQTGFAWSKGAGRRLWQKRYWDRTLRADDEILSIARYIVENPVRARLVSDPRSYRWTGSGEYTIDQILDAAQIDLWKKWQR